MDTAIIRGAEKIAALLDVEFSYSPAHHNFELGLPLENALRTFFRPYFPARYGFSSGYLVDENSLVSGQTDWIIYDAVNAAPIIPSSGTADNIEWLPVDCVFGTVEVKRTISETTLRKACEQIARAKALHRKPTNLFRFFPYFDYKPLYATLEKDLKDHERSCNYLYNGIYAFQIDAENSTLAAPEKFIDNFVSLTSEIGYERMPDFIAVHGRFFLRKMRHTDDEGRIDFTRFVTTTNGFALAETKQNTSGVFYLDLLSQFADTLLSMQYQSDALARVVRKITGGTVSIARRRPE